MSTQANNQNENQKNNEGYVTPEQVNKYNEELNKTFGKIKIVSEGPSITDLLKEQK